MWGKFRRWTQFFIPCTRFQCYLCGDSSKLTWNSTNAEYSLSKNSNETALVLRVDLRWFEGWNMHQLAQNVNQAEKGWHVCLSGKVTLTGIKYWRPAKEEKSPTGRLRAFLIGIKQLCKCRSAASLRRCCESNFPPHRRSMRFTPVFPAYDGQRETAPRGRRPTTPTTVTWRGDARSPSPRSSTDPLMRHNGCEWDFATAMI